GTARRHLGGRLEWAPRDAIRRGPHLGARLVAAERDESVADRDDPDQRVTSQPARLLRLPAAVSVGPKDADGATRVADEDRDLAIKRDRAADDRTLRQPR